MFRLGRMRPAHARSSGSETLLRIRFLAGYIIGTLESRFRKRQDANLDDALAETFPASDPPSMTQPRTGADASQSSREDSRSK
jgi:hypothetical protein